MFNIWFYIVLFWLHSKVSKEEFYVICIDTCIVLYTWPIIAKAVMCPEQKNMHVAAN